MGKCIFQVEMEMQDVFFFTSCPLGRWPLSAVEAERESLLCFSEA